jgi:ribonuclease P protein component
MPEFKKEERLCAKKSIDFLFKNGKPMFSYPFNVKWHYAELATTFPVQVLIVVSKRNFKKATDRNRIKRLIREAYRLNKHILYQYLNKKNKNIVLTLIYTEKEILNYHFIADKIILTLQRLIKLQEKAD